MRRFFQLLLLSATIPTLAWEISKGQDHTSQEVWPGIEDTSRAVTYLRPGVHGLNHHAIRELRLHEPNELTLAELCAQTFSLMLMEQYMNFGQVTPEISGNHTPITFFMPTNYAFEELEQDLISKLRDHSWEAHLRDLFHLHMHLGDIPVDDLEDSQTITMANGKDVVVTRTPGTKRVRVDGVLCLAIYDASDGTVYMLDEVLLPDWIEVLLLDIIATSLSIMKRLITRAGYDEMLNDPTESLTIFAPTDEAFQRDGTLDYLMSDAGLELSKESVKYHIVAGGPYPSTRFFNQYFFTKTLTTLEGGTFELVEGDPVTIYGRRSEARIIQADLLAGNGLIHVIDTVLAPPGIVDCTVKSDFHMGSEGWTTHNEDNFVWTSGYIKGGAQGRVEYFYFVAPTKFHGDMLEAYGKTIQYDFKTSHPFWTDQYPDIVIAREGFKLEYTGGPKTDTWTTYTAVLAPNNGWVKSGTTTRPATEQDFKFVLENVTNLRILGESSAKKDSYATSTGKSGKSGKSNKGADIGYLDNVVFNCGVNN